MKRFFIALIALTSGFNLLTAQNPVWQKDEYINGTDNRPTYKLLLSDFSGDNKLDIISAQDDGWGNFKISYRVNEDDGYFPNYTVLKSYTSSYFYRDMDTISAIAGGVQELAVGYRQVTGGVTTHKVDILKKSGSAFIQDYTITLPAGSSDIKLVRTGSFDGVANPIAQLSDLAVTSGDKVYIYCNNKDNSIRFGDISNFGYPNFTMQTSGMGTVEGINTGEFYNSGYGYDQNEGYNEILLTDGGDRIRRWKNNTPEAGSNWFVQFAGDPLVNPTLPYYTEYTSRPIFAADMNNDGVQDFIMKPGIRLNTSGNPFSWPNNPDYTIFFDPYTPYGSHLGNVAVADFNNDGKLDILGSFITVLVSIPSSRSEHPFICYNDGSNGLPDDNANIVFNDVFYGSDWPCDYMTFLTGDISNKGAISIIRLTETGGESGVEKKIVVYRRTDNPAPAPPKMKSIINFQGNPKISWYANPEKDVTVYELYRGIGTATSLPTYWTLVTTTNSTSFVDDQITWSGTSATNKLYYRIKAKDQVNQYSNWSNLLMIDYVSEIQKQNAGNEHLIFSLHQNYPNPFNPITSISYVVPSSSKVNLAIYNSLGQLVKVLVNGTEESGAKQVLWNGKDEKGQDVSSGVYVYKLQIGQQTAVKKMMFVK